MKMTQEAHDYMMNLAKEYVAAGYPPAYGAWMFDRGNDGDVHNELRALGLIKLLGMKGAAYVLTAAGHEWVMENREI